MLYSQHHTLSNPKDLDTLGGDTSFAFQLNNTGWVAGSADLTAGGPQRLFLYYGGGRADRPRHSGRTKQLGGRANLFGEAAIGFRNLKTDLN